MKVAFIINDLQSMDLKKDTSIFLAKEAFDRGYEVHTFNTNNLSVQDERLFALTSKLIFPTKDQLSFNLSNNGAEDLSEFTHVINRVNPPFNKDYLYMTLLLDAYGVPCINPTKALREINEKLSILKFPEIIPSTRVTASLQTIKDMFNQGFDTLVIKPLDGMGGRSIFLVHKDDKNLAVIWETITGRGKHLVIVQEYIPEAESGDNRIVIINGELLEQKLVRVPSPLDFRGNLAAGATSKVEKVTNDDKKIAQQILPFLKEHNIYFAGADILGGKLSELNITSPTCLQEINNASDINPSEVFWDGLGDS